MMDRRSALTGLLAGLTGVSPALRSAAAQHHTMAPATGSSDGRGALIFAAATLKPALDAIVSFLRDGTQPANKVTLLTPIAITKDNLNQSERLSEVK